MSVFAEDFSEGVGDVLGQFGEVVTWVSPAGVETAGTAVVSRRLNMGEEQGSALDKVQMVTLDVAAEALPGDVNADLGWVVLIGGVHYTVVKAGASAGGMWRVEAKMRANASLGLGRR